MILGSICRFLPLVSPFSAKNILERVLVHICVDAVDEVVRRHDSPRISLPNSNLERFEINLTKRSLSNERVYRESVGLLLIPNEICQLLAHPQLHIEKHTLDGRRDTSILKTLDVLRRQLSSKQRIF